MSDLEREWLRKQQLALAKELTLHHNSNSNANTYVVDSTLGGIDPEELQLCSETLIRKRISQTASLLPISNKVLGPDFEPRFRTFASKHFFNGPTAIWRDAIEFARWMGNQRSNPSWLADCLTWESKRCLWESSRYYIATFRLRYTVHQVLERDRDVPPDLQHRRVVLWRFRNHGAIRIA